MAGWSVVDRGAGGGGQRHKTVNIFLGYFFMVNFCLGTGFLGVPYSFFYSGYLAAVPTLAVAAFVTWLTSTWLLEVMARAQALESSRALPSSTDSDREVEERMSLALSDTKTPVFEITVKRKFEPVELSELFVGKWFKYLYLSVVTIYSFLSCWSFATVAASAWASNIPYNFATLKICVSDAFHHQILPPAGCLSSYYFSIFLFGIIVVFLSILDLKEQAVVQIFLGSARFLTVGAVVIYSIVKLSQGGDACLASLSPANWTYDNDSNSSLSAFILTEHNATRYTSYKDIVLKFDPKGWVAAIPVFTFAFIIHTGISSLSHPVKQKKYLHWMLAAMSLTALVSYMSLGVVVPLWFKSSVQETVTLNWNGFTGSENSLALRVLSYYLIFFPSLDVMSAFPLTVHCMVNNIYIILTGRDTSEKPRWKLDWLFRFFLRFVAALLPLLAALGIANLIYILKYAGLFGFAIALFLPATLQLRSIYVCNREFRYAQMIGSERTPLLIQSHEQVQLRGLDVVSLLGVLDFRKESRRHYETPYSRGILSHPLVVIVMICLGVCLFIMAVTSLIVTPHKIKCSL